MHTNIEKVQFILRFCALRLEQLSEKELDTVAHELREFLGWQDTPDDWQDTSTLSLIVALSPLQDRLRRDLTSYVAECRRTESGVVLTPEERRAVGRYRYRTLLPDASVRLSADASGTARMAVVSDSVDANVLVATAVAIRGIDSRRLRQCPACSTLFVALDNRQQFCSLPCGSRARLQAARAAKRKPVKKTAHQQRLAAIFFPPALR